MKAVVTVKQEIEIKYLRIEVPCEYEIDYLSEEEIEQFSDSMDAKKEKWIPLIDLDNGVVINWRKGFEFSVYFKPVDEGVYTFYDDEMIDIYIHKGYVPDFLGIDDTSYGDYICLTIDGEGKIKDWSVDRVIEYLEE